MERLNPKGSSEEWLIEAGESGKGAYGETPGQYYFLPLGSMAPLH